MALLIGAVAWGLITFAAIGHLWHQKRLQQLLAAHTDHERPAAALLTTIEVVLAVATPVALLASDLAITIASGTLALLGVGFTVWIARLLATGSDLPCACSFSAGPTSPWSLLRAILLIGALGLVAPVAASTAEAIVTLAVGLAIAGAVYVLPESLSWPEASRAQLARMESHRSIGLGDRATP